MQVDGSSIKLAAETAAMCAAIQMNGEEFRKAARTATSCAGGWGRVMDLVHIRCVGGRATLTSTDGMVSIITTLDCSESEPFSAIVVASALSGSADRVSGDIRISSEDGKMMVGGEDGAFTLPLAAGAENNIPAALPVPLASGCYDDMISILKVLTRVSCSAPHDSVRIRPLDADRVQITGSDYSCGISVITHGPDLGHDVVVPSDSLRKACGLMKGLKAIGYKDRYLYLDDGVTRAATPARTDGYPAIDPYFDMPITRVMVVDRSEFEYAMKRASYTSISHRKATWMRANGCNVLIHGLGQRGQFRSTIKGDGDLHDVIINSTIIVEILGLIDDPSVAVCTAGDDKGCSGVKIVSDRCTAVIAPMAQAAVDPFMD